MSEPLIKPEDAQKLDVEVDVDTIRKGLEKLLSDPDIVSFLRELVELASEEAAKDGKPSPVSMGGDLMKVFDEVLRQGGIRRARGDEANHAVGFISQRNATIRIGAIRPGGAVTMTQLLKMYPPHDLAYALHETLHHAGINRISDKHYAAAVCRMLKQDWVEQEAKNKFRFSAFWDEELLKRCKIKKFI